MIKGILITLRWTLSLGKKFTKVTPWQTMSIVALTLVSQISMILASFLPLKVVILLGSNGMPRYIPDVLAAQGRDALIVGLSIATVGFFVLHLFAERVIAFITIHATEKLMEKSHKMVLFENQNELAANSYQRFSRALAGGVFILLSLIGLYYFYHEMALVVLVFFILVFLLFYYLVEITSSFYSRLETKLSSTLNLVSGIGFMVSFAYLVVDFIWLAPPGVIIAIISLLLTRQIFMRSSSGIQDLVALRGQQIKIDALFFHGKLLIPQQIKEDKSIWFLLNPRERNTWLNSVLKEIVVDWKGLGKVFFHQSGVNNVIAFHLIEKETKKNYLIKVFEVNRKSLALHETTLTGEPPEGLPSLSLAGVTTVQRFNCLVYDMPVGVKVYDLRKLRRLIDSIHTQLWAVEPQRSIVEQYKRSRPFMWQRIDVSMLYRIRMTCSTAGDRALVSAVINEMPEITQLLSALPLVIINPEIGLHSVWHDSKRKCGLLINWTRWSLEPIGFGWSIKESEFKKIEKVLTAASETRRSLRKVRPEAVMLVALMSAFELRYIKQQYEEALGLLVKILDVYTSLKNDPEHAVQMLA